MKLLLSFPTPEQAFSTFILYHDQNRIVEIDKAIADFLGFCSKKREMQLNKLMPLLEIEFPLATYQILTVAYLTRNIDWLIEERKQLLRQKTVLETKIKQGFLQLRYVKRCKKQDHSEIAEGINLAISRTLKEEIKLSNQLNILKSIINVLMAIKKYT